jgi:precorrin-2 dehydrogenase/sirohydrochlorin ferrochelatase
MDAFPAFFPLRGRTVVVAGDGEQAEAKARLFADSPARLVRRSAVEALAPGAFEGALLAFIAGDEAFCRQAADAARAAGALVNAVDRPALSDFNTPALVDRGEVVVGIGTAGAAPMMAALLRSELETRIPEGAGRVAALFKRLQEEVRAAFPDLAQRRAFLREAFASPAAEAAAAGDMDRAEALLRQALKAPRPAQGRLCLLAAAGPARLISLAAVQALAATDVLVVGPGSDPAVAALARRDAERIEGRPPAADLARLSAHRTVVVLVADGLAALAETLDTDGVGYEVLPVALEA